MHIAVVGTGIVGACTAAWLQRDGHQITFVDPLEPGEACRRELALPGVVHAAKNLDILRSFAARPTEAARRIHLHFLRAPAALHGDERVRRIALAGQQLSGEPGAQSAVETGEHLFYEAQGDGPLALAGRARFSQMWKLEDGRWKLARVLSWDSPKAN